MQTVNKRVLKDIKDGKKNLKQEFGIHIAPEEDNIYRIHFILPGPEDTPFEGGLYHGMIRLNDQHPRSPPNIHMITPSGRFKPEKCPVPATSRGICTTTSAFHPEAWTPLNNIETVLKGFISLMCDPADVGVGGMQSNPAEQKKLAKASLKHLQSDDYVKKLFPQLHKSLVDQTYQPVKLGDLNRTNHTTQKEAELVQPNTKKLKPVANDFSEDDLSDVDNVNNDVVEYLSDEDSNDDLSSDTTAEQSADQSADQSSEENLKHKSKPISKRISKSKETIKPKSNTTTKPKSNPTVKPKSNTKTKPKSNPTAKPKPKAKPSIKSRSESLCKPKSTTKSK